jgi:hypothetical protein
MSASLEEAFAMNLLSGPTPKKLLLATFTIAAIGVGLPSFALAQPESHPGTLSALRCLVRQSPDGCEAVFRAAAEPPSRWRFAPHFQLGDFESVNYAGTMSGDNPYAHKFLRGASVDIYDVRFQHAELTFYISPPDLDGKIRHLLIRNGPPGEERRDLFASGPG